MDELRIRGANGWTPLMVGALRRDSKLLQDALAENICVNAVNKVCVACLLVIGRILRTLCYLILNYKMV